MATPAEPELVSAIQAVRDAHPDLGILKLWAQLKTEHPQWTVSEKRFRKALAAAGGTASGAGANPPGSGSSGTKANPADGAELVAHTGIDATLDIAAVAPKVKAKMFGGTKGKGLVAKSKIEMGEVLWHEEPWVACPDPGLTPHLVSKRFCTTCLAQFREPNPPLSQECPNCTTATFCNRLCLSRARPTASHHDLLCPGVNPTAGPLMHLISTAQWRSLDAVARIVAKWRYAHGWDASPAAADELATRVWDGIARVNMATREGEKDDWAARADYTTRQWQAAHAALVAALNPEHGLTLATSGRATRSSSSSSSSRKGRALSDADVQRWFSYDSFLELLGMVNINLEDSGGLYAVHAHLNHSCDPNVQVRNLPRGYTAPTPEQLPCALPERNPPGVRGTHRLTMLARRPIATGTELTVSYVDLGMGRAERRAALREGYGFWCVCTRCEAERVAEEKEERRRVKDKERAEARKEAAARALRGESTMVDKKKDVSAAVDTLADKMDDLAVGDESVIEEML